MDGLENRKVFLLYYRMPEETFDKLAPHLEKNDHMARECVVFKTSERISSEHPPQSSGKVSEGLGGNIGSRDKTSSWYEMCITFVHVIATAVVPQLLSMLSLL